MEKPETLDDLPILVLEHLADILDYASRQKCRQVSSKLKACVDYIGLSVRIDTRIPENFNFCQSVNVTEAHVLYMKALKLSKDHLETWKTAILSGPIDSFSLSNGLQMNCANLRVLIIRDNCLTSQNFNEPIQPLPVFNHLTTVQLSLTEQSLTKAVAEARSLMKGVSFTSIDKKMDARVQRNMAYLMKTVRSRVLKVFHAFVFVTLKSDENRRICWEHGPLFEFLESHRNTLEEVAIPNLFSGEVNHERNSYDFPVKLQTLVCSALLHKHLLAYWQALMMSQQKLKQLVLHDKVHSSEFIPFFQSVLSNNARTLKALTLTVATPMKETTLDMTMLTECKLLEFLEILALSKVMILNLNNLPLAHLAKLGLLGQIIVGGDFDGVQLMEDSNLRCLIIRCISMTGPFKDRRQTLRFIKMSLRSRTMNAFCFGFEKGIEDRQGWTLNPATDSDDTGFLKRLISFERDVTGNLMCASFFIWDTHDQLQSLHSKTHANLPSSYPYFPSNDDREYLQMLSSNEMLRAREQPFNLPRNNKDSYTTWINQETKARKIMANTKSYTLRVEDIRRVQASIVTAEWVPHVTLREKTLDSEVLQKLSTLKIGAP